MKKKRFQLSKLGNLVKQITTKNVWLKILSLILAIATYIALYDNTVKNTEKKENADIISNFPFSSKPKTTFSAAVNTSTSLKC